MQIHIVDLAKGEEVGSVNVGGHVAASVAIHGERAYVGNMANQFLTIEEGKGIVQQNPPAATKTTH